jgi:hypothetical protein
MRPSIRRLLSDECLIAASDRAAAPSHRAFGRVREAVLMALPGALSLTGALEPSTTSRFARRRRAQDPAMASSHYSSLSARPCNETVVRSCLLMAFSVA